MEYVAAYDSTLLRGIDDPQTPRPWDLSAAIIQAACSNKILLDIGCGTAIKIVPLSSHFQKIIALDPSLSMLEAAKKNILAAGIDNIQLIKAVGEQLPFRDKSIDIVTCMVSRWNVAEIQRVLAPDGVVVIEHIGCEDKKEFKLFFGKDEQGWRGQLINYHPQEYLSMYEEIFSKFFNKVQIKNGFWDTYYTVEGIKQLLAYTPTIRNYNEKKDAESLRNVIKHFNTEQGIKLTQNRILIYADDLRC